MTTARPDPADTLPIVEEKLVVDRRVVPTGRVSVRTVTEAIDADLEAVLARSEVDVTRVAVDRTIDAMPEVRFEGDTVIVPVVEEVPVVTTRLVLKEEIHIKRRRTEEAHVIPVQLLKQRAVVTREGLNLERNRTDTMADVSNLDRTLTAFFDRREDAEEAMVRLTSLGIADVRLTGGEEFAGRTDVAGDKGFWESISDFFFPADDRATYAEGLRRGGYLVTARNVPSDRHDEVLDILDDEGSVDLDQRADSWRAEGWSGGPAADAAMGSTAYAAGDMSATGAIDDPAFGRGADVDLSREPRAGIDETAELRGGRFDAGRLDTDRTRTGDEEVIPVMRESLRVGKRDVSLGRVRVRSYMVEEPVSEDVTLHEERVEIERRPVDREVGTDEAFTDRTIEAEERAEEAVISKEARVVEEVALRRHAEDRTETVSDTVRHTEIDVEDDRKAAEELQRR